MKKKFIATFHKQIFKDACLNSELNTKQAKQYDEVRYEPLLVNSIYT